METALSTMIIEDNPGDFQLLKIQLESAGWPVKNSTHKEKLADALESLKNSRPAIVLLDLNLPDSNGLETFLSVQNIAPDIPIVILSGLNDTSLCVQAVQAGAQDYLVKGEFEEKLLLKTILYSIERKKNQIRLDEINKRFTYASLATNEPLWDWDIKSNEILWNDKVKIFGYHDSINKNRSWRINNIHPEDKDRVIAKLNDLLGNSHEIWNEQYRFRCADGSYKFIHDRGYVLRDKQNRPLRMIGTMQDITEQILLRQKLEEEKEEKQKAILKAAIEAQEKERNYIGQELHDNVNQILVAANMTLSRVVSGNEARTITLIKESRELISRAVEEIRNLVRNIISTQVKDIGLIDSITSMTETLNSLETCKISFSYTGDAGLPDYNIALTVFRTIQEQLNNIFKHSAAAHTWINLKILPDMLQLEIADDGKGANQDILKKGIGLSNIFNRVRAYNGRASIETAPGKGFKLSATLPVKHTENLKWQTGDFF
jgi:two-component system, NarL family, sensor histidine kinase UhpB